MTMTSPLRGPHKHKKEAASPPLISRAGRAGYGAAPPASRCSASRCARQPCGLPWTPETTAAPGSRNSGQAQACPATRAARRPRRHGRSLSDSG